MSTNKKATKKKAVKKNLAAKKKKTAAKKGPAKSKKTSTPKKSVKKPKTQAKSISTAKAKSKTKVKTKTKAKAKPKTKVKTKIKTSGKIKTKTKSQVKAKLKTAKPKKSLAKTVASKKKDDKQDIPVKPKPKKPVKLDGTTLKIRSRLMENRSELLRLLESSQALERNVGELNFSNEIDLASSLEGREMGFQLSSRDRNELKLIDEALVRMKDGTYGVCDSCDKKIGSKRLQILPLTSLCIECQESLEYK